MVLFVGGGFADRIHNICLADETLFSYDRIDVRLCEPNRSSFSWLVSFERERQSTSRHRIDSHRPGRSPHNDIEEAV